VADALFIMYFSRQPVATDGNAFRLSWRIPSRS